MKTKRFILMMLVMLMSVTGAWAGSGTGTISDPYSGRWDNKLEFGAILKPGDYLALDCHFAGARAVTFIDTELEEKIVPAWADWTVGTCILNPYSQYQQYVQINDDCSSHLLIVDFVLVQSAGIKVYGHFTGIYNTEHTHQYSTDMHSATFYTCATCNHINIARKDGVHVHSYIWLKNDDTHWQECVKQTGFCDAKKKDEGPHVYSDDKNSGEEYYLCQICGYLNTERRAEIHIHDYQTRWSHDENTHWHACVGTGGECDAPKSNENSHNFETYAKKCTECGYIIPHDHVYQESGGCTLCGECDHTFAPDDDTQCVCTKCNHGFFRYEGTGTIDTETYKKYHTFEFPFLDSEYNPLTIIKNEETEEAGHYVVELDSPIKILSGLYLSSSVLRGSLVIPKSVTKIDDSAFWGCEGFTGIITIPNSVTAIGEDAFRDCKGFTGIIIPNSVTAIGENAFQNCGNTRFFTVVVSWETPIDVDERAFGELSGKTLCVHASSLDPYNEKSPWSGFGTKTRENHTYSEEQGTAAYYTCSVCNSIDPVRQHVHHYVASEVTTEGHVYVCTSEVGECTVPEIRGGHTLEVVDGTYVCSLCGWTHEHNYMWKNDETKHWTECDGEGECNARTKDEAEHNIHESILCDTENYMCDVCQYVDEEKKAQFGADRDYLSMKAVGGDVRIGFKNQGTPDSYTIQVSEDGNHWSEPQTLNAETTLATIPQGATYYFRHGSAEATNHISSGDGKYWSFTMTSTSDDATVEAGGNIMSLLDATCRQTELPMTPQHVFTKLFMNCEKLTVAPRMDAITAVPQWGFVSMFSGSGIKEAPALSTTHIRDGAYRAMFENCKELVSVPVLSATTLNRCAYWDMFKGCDKLTSIEIANIESMVVEEGTSGRENSFHDMLANTAVGADGTLIAPVAMMGDTRISLPSNWQWTTKLKANQDPDYYEPSFYTTFYDSRNAYILPEGVKAYTAEVDYNDDVIILTRIEGDILPKGEAVLLHSNVSGDMLMTVSAENGTKDANNQFLGVDVATSQSDYGPYNYYMLSYGQYGLNFYKMKEETMLAAYKAFIAHSHFAEAKAMRMVFVEDEETGIDNINDNDNDTLRYDNDNIYSLSGVRLNKLQKGINIVNGKKIVVK